jgi:3-oxoacyl-[acyl-carrier protein] reductase
MKKVLVTGATGSIGEEIVKEYAKNGFFVYIHYNSNHQKAQNLLEEIDNKGELISFDIKDKESIKNSLENLDVDVLINNAGIIKDNLFFFMSDDEWEDVINTNLNGNFYITKIISKNMMMNKKGSIVNIASISGVSGNAGQANYSASKGGIIALTKK